MYFNTADQELGITALVNSLTDFMRVMNTNMVWNYCLSELAVKRMTKNGRSSIVFINPNTAYGAFPNRIAYSTSNSGLLGIMRAMALDFGKYNVYVNTMSPGIIKPTEEKKSEILCKCAVKMYSSRRCRSRMVLFCGSCKEYHRHGIGF